MRITTQRSVAALAFLVVWVWGCSSLPGPARRAGEPRSDEMQRVVDRMINDRNNWVDPVIGF